MARGYYDDMKKLNDDQYIVAWFLEAARSGINLDEVAPEITAGEQAMEQLKKLVDGDDLGATEAATRTAQEKVDEAYRAILEYRDRQISAGKTTVTVLQVTETVCFTVFAVAGGAVLAAPVAAGGLGLGVVSSGAIMGGGTALLTSASGVGAKAYYGDEIGSAPHQERRHRHSGRRRRRGGRLGGWPPSSRLSWRRRSPNPLWRTAFSPTSPKKLLPRRSPPWWPVPPAAWCRERSRTACVCSAARPRWSNCCATS